MFQVHHKKRSVLIEKGSVYFCTHAYVAFVFCTHVAFVSF